MLGVEHNMSQIGSFIRNALGEFGDILDDKSVIELSANPNGCVFVVRHGCAPELLGELDSNKRASIIRFCASAIETPVTKTSPIVSAKMPETGFRFEGIIPPAADAPLFSIRFHGAKLFTMSDYIDQGVVTVEQSNKLKSLLRDRKNIVISGGTGSGKTTFLNMMVGELRKLSADERLIIIEDTPEIRTVLQNVVFLNTTNDVDMTRLLASSLRLKPERIIVGEVRDGAALAMVKALNTGHSGGLTSVHANSARAALTRLDSLVREASAMPLPEVIAEGIDVIVHINADRTGRKVSEIIEVEGYSNGEYKIK